MHRFFFRYPAWWFVLTGALWALPAAAQPEVVARGMVVSAHPLASIAGRNVLSEGGNATDAAITTAFVLAVVEPYSSGLGGGGFAVALDGAAQRFSALDFRETAPALAHKDMYLRNGTADAQLSRQGGLAVAVPGMVLGLWEMHKKGGKLPWKRLVEPAIAAAEQGFPVYSLLRDRLLGNAQHLDAHAQSIFLPQSTVPLEGEVLVQAELADTLKLVRDQGPLGFYAGPVAEKLVAGVQKSGGILTLDDLQQYQVKWREPLVGTYRGHTVVSMPPPSSGGVALLQMLNILEGFDLGRAKAGSADSWHWIIETMKFAFADRSVHMGDPDFVDVPTTKLTSKEYAAGQRKRIQRTKTIPEEDIEGVGLAPEKQHTTHLSVVDRQGNAVAMTLTINLSFGSGVVPEGTGVVLNDEMDDFVAQSGVPNAFGLVGNEKNAVAAHKRPLSSMTPTIVTQNGRVRIVTGSPGGPRIISTTLLTVLGVIDFGMDANAAVTYPRVHHQWFPKVATIERFGISPDTVAILTKRGHKLKEIDPFCNAQLITIDPQTHEPEGGSDPRGEGSFAAE
ncbi:MAG: gamma-glutamyltransferase [Myxococcales bacterium]|nr:gamma-glutamyltransferase [Myxococcales bacterium]